MIAQTERERDRDRERGGGGHRSSHQWRHLDTELQRWPHDSAQQRRPVVFGGGDGSEHEEERLEPGWVWWVMWVLLSHLL
jgi:hypothetical protein